MNQWSRRSVLQSLALGAGSLTFGAGRPGELFSSARAAEAAVAKRIVIFPIANGVSDYADFGSIGSSPTNFTLGPMLKPLETLGLRDQLVCLDNLEMKRPSPNVDQHFSGLTQVLTGPFPPENRNQRSVGISIDQYLAKKISAGLPFGQLYMGTMCDSVSYSYLANGTSVPANSNPLNVYQNVFGRFSGGGDPAVQRRLSRRQSVLDLVAKDMSSFLKRLPAEDRERAEAQTNAIEDMERQLKASFPKGGQCFKPTIDTKVNYSIDDSVPLTMRAIIDLTVASLACDQTRVVLFHSYAREYHPPNFNCPWAPVNVPGMSFHGLSHDDLPAFRRAKAFHYQLAGELANKLKSIPEPGGGTMLDHTIIFIPTEIGRGHTAAGLQFLTIGGRGLGVNTGRYLQLGTDRGMNKGVPHQRLLVSLLNAVGVNDTTFGDTATTGSGPVNGFFV